MVDIIITTWNRVDLLRRTLESLWARAKDGLPYRLWIHDDCSEDETPRYLQGLKDRSIAYIALSKKRAGVVAGFNMLWNMVDYYDSFWEEMPYLCYLQDDVEFEEDNWLTTLIRAYEELSEKESIGFFTGYNAPEHPVDSWLNWGERRVFLKFSTTATNLVGTKAFWRSIGWIPRLNPDGSERGFPHKNRGSHIDVYLTGCASGSRFAAKATAPNSSYLQGKKVLVVPDLIRHNGAPEIRSTWRRRN